MPRSRTTTRHRNARGRFLAGPAIDVRSPTQIPQFESMLRRGPITFVLVYADWCGHCQRYKPMWKSLSRTPGRQANMAAVSDVMFPKIQRIANAKIQGFPSVIKVSPDGSIERYNVNGEMTNAIDSAKMRDIPSMRKELTTPPRRVMASKMSEISKTPDSAEPLNATKSILRNSGFKAAAPSSNTATIADDSVDIYTPVTSLSKEPGFKKGTYTSAPGSLLTPEDRSELGLGQNGGQRGGAISIAAAFASAVQSVGPAALLLAAHAILPKRGRTFKSPKRSSHRGGTRRNRY